MHFTQISKFKCNRFPKNVETIVGRLNWTLELSLTEIKMSFIRSVSEFLCIVDEILNDGVEFVVVYDSAVGMGEI